MLFFLVFSSTVELKAGSLNKLGKYFARAIPTVCETILDAFPTRAIWLCVTRAAADCVVLVLLCMHFSGRLVIPSKYKLTLCFWAKKAAVVCLDVVKKKMLHSESEQHAWTQILVASVKLGSVFGWGVGGQISKPYWVLSCRNLLCLARWILGNLCRPGYTVHKEVGKVGGDIWFTLHREFKFRKGYKQKELLSHYYLKLERCAKKVPDNVKSLVSPESGVTDAPFPQATLCPSSAANGTDQSFSRPRWRKVFQTILLKTSASGIWQ